MLEVILLVLSTAIFSSASTIAILNHNFRISEKLDYSWSCPGEHCMFSIQTNDIETLDRFASAHSCDTDQ